MTYDMPELTDLQYVKPKAIMKSLEQIVLVNFQEHPDEQSQLEQAIAKGYLIANTEGNGFWRLNPQIDLQNVSQEDFQVLCTAAKYAQMRQMLVNISYDLAARNNTRFTRRVGPIAGNTHLEGALLAAECAGLDSEEVLLEAIAQVTDKPTFTPHPTESLNDKSREYIAKVERDIERLSNSTMQDSGHTADELKRHLSKLWYYLTPPERKMTVSEEVDRVIALTENLAAEIPSYMTRIIDAIANTRGDQTIYQEGIDLHYFYNMVEPGNWAIDRDGKPNVVAGSVDTTKSKFRDSAKALYLGILQELRGNDEDGTHYLTGLDPTERLRIQQRIDRVSRKIENDEYKTTEALIEALEELRYYHNGTEETLILIPWTHYQNEVGKQYPFTHMDILCATAANLGVEMSRTETRQNSSVHARMVERIYSNIHATLTGEAYEFGEGNPDNQGKIDRITRLINEIQTPQTREAWHQQLNTMLAMARETRERLQEQFDQNQISNDGLKDLRSLGEYIDNMEVLQKIADDPRGVPLHIIADCTVADPLILFFMLKVMANDPAHFDANIPIICPLLESRETLESVSYMKSVIEAVPELGDHYLFMFAGSDSYKRVGIGVGPIRALAMQEVDDAYGGRGSGVARSGIFEPTARRTEQGRKPGRSEYEPVRYYEALLSQKIHENIKSQNLDDGAPFEEERRAGNIGKTFGKGLKTHPEADTLIPETLRRCGNVCTEYQRVYDQTDSLVTYGMPNGIVAKFNFSARPDARLPGDKKAKMDPAYPTPAHTASMRAIGFNLAECISGNLSAIWYGLSQFQDPNLSPQEDFAMRQKLGETAEIQEMMLSAAYGVSMANMEIGFEYIGYTLRDHQPIANAYIYDRNNHATKVTDLSELQHLGMLTPADIADNAQAHPALALTAMKTISDAINWNTAKVEAFTSPDLLLAFQNLELATREGDLAAALEGYKQFIQIVDAQYNGNGESIHDQHNPNQIVDLIERVRASSGGKLSDEQAAIVSVLEGIARYGAVATESARAVELEAATRVVYEHFSKKMLPTGQHITQQELLKVIPVALADEIIDDRQQVDASRRLMVQLHHTMEQHNGDMPGIPPKEQNEMLWRLFNGMGEVFERSPAAMREPNLAVFYSTSQKIGMAA